MAVIVFEWQLDLYLHVLCNLCRSPHILVSLTTAHGKMYLIEYFVCQLPVHVLAALDRGFLSEL